jgi:hypothetical protein
MSTLLIILLILLLLGAFGSMPQLGWHQGGYGLSGSLGGILLIIVIVLLLTGRLG